MSRREGGASASSDRRHRSPAAVRVAFVIVGGLGGCLLASIAAVAVLLVLPVRAEDDPRFLTFFVLLVGVGGLVGCAVGFRLTSRMRLSRRSK